MKQSAQILHVQLDALLTYIDLIIPTQIKIENTFSISKAPSCPAPSQYYYHPR